MDGRHVRIYGPVGEESFLILDQSSDEGHFLTYLVCSEIRAYGPVGEESFLILGQKLSKSCLTKIPFVGGLTRSTLADSIEEMVDGMGGDVEGFFRKL